MPGAGASLGTKTDSAESESGIAVEHFEYDSFAFQWFIDGRPLSIRPIGQAGELVFFTEQIPAGVTCRAEISDAGGVIAIGTI